MYSFDDFQKAMDNCLAKEHWWDGTTFDEMRKYERDDIQKLSDAFVKKYGFRLLDIEIDLIWCWHSVDWAANWLIVGNDTEKDLVFFDKFVERWL